MSSKTLGPSLQQSFRSVFEAIKSLSQERPRGGTTEPEALARLRADLRRALTSLRSEVEGRLTERESYLALFALAVHIDEIMLTTFLGPDYTQWSLLQKELFDTDQGGDLFYQAVDEILDGQFAPMVYQVYYFSLSLGFRGKYVDQPEQAAQVMKRLRDRLVAQLPEEAEVTEVEARPEQVTRVKRVTHFGWYYAAAAVLVVALYLLLGALARSSSTDEPMPKGTTAMLLSP